jgi:hypothetical protein
MKFLQGLHKRIFHDRFCISSEIVRLYSKIGQINELIIVQSVVVSLPIEALAAGRFCLNIGNFESLKKHWEEKIVAQERS